MDLEIRNNMLNDRQQIQSLKPNKYEMCTPLNNWNIYNYVF